MTKKLILDFDNTIVNSTKAFVEIYNLICGKRFMFDRESAPNWEKVKRYDFTDQIPTLSNSFKQTIFDEAIFYERLEYYDNAKEIIEELSHKTEVQIISMSTYKSLIYKGEKLEKDLPKVRFQPIVYHHFQDKSHIDMKNAVFIDDVSKNLITSSADRKICFKYQGITQDINKDWNGELLMNWNDETYKYLKEILEIV